MSNLEETIAINSFPDTIAENQRKLELYSAIIDEYQKEIIPGFQERTEEAEAENKRLLVALHESIASPKGVVPDSAVEFYDPERFYDDV